MSKFFCGFPVAKMLLAILSLPVNSMADVWPGATCYGETMSMSVVDEARYRGCLDKGRKHHGLREGELLAEGSCRRWRRHYDRSHKDKRS
ncbi:hypothetical protein [uncultured Phenylobacterium sp.]|uniref:hypothetical protein n=1 Tax=uncultured Phenylobacterium sp. TaxID=349273 RepID=UPI0025F67ABE|nr:hypothetical protein [uncultured Phenylobacterium sp.]